MSSNPTPTDHLKELREDYYRAFPRQRVGVARKRIGEAKDGLGISLLIAYVSAIEGILRSLVIWNEKEAGEDRLSRATYHKYKRWGPKKLYKEYCRQFNEESDNIVAGETKDRVWDAVEYRHLVVHECTFLMGGYSRI